MWPSYPVDIYLRFLQVDHVHGLPSPRVLVLRSCANCADSSLVWHKLCPAGLNVSAGDAVNKRPSYSMLLRPRAHQGTSAATPPAAGPALEGLKPHVVDFESHALGQRAYITSSHCLPHSTGMCEVTTRTGIQAL